MIDLRFLSHLFRWLTLFLLMLMLPLAAHGTEVKEITDHDGFSHRFEKPFERIISLYPAHTENLAQLGAQDALIGISSGDTYPEFVLNKPRYSYHDSIEKFIAAQPDCILIRPMISRSASHLIKQLRQYGITIISLQPTTPEELYQYWYNLGLLTGRDSNASRMIRDFKNSLEAIKTKVDKVPSDKRPLVYFESIHARMKTFSPNSITIFCLETAGGTNVATDANPRKNSNIAAYSKERILAHADKIDFYLAQSGRMNRITRSQIINEPGYGAIKAVKNDRVFLVEEHLVSRPTTRLLEGITYINNLLYTTHDS